MTSEEHKAATVHTYFEAIAFRYDLMNALLSFGLYHFWKRSAMGMAGLKEGDAVIDVCGGTAELSLLAARAVGRAGRVVLYDFSLEMIRVGKQKAARTPFAPLISCVRGDAQHIAAGDRTFDAAVIGFGLRNLTDMEQGLREINRVLKPGGRLMCFEFSQPVSPLFRWLYDIYSFVVIPIAGKIITGAKDAYTYLPESIRGFPLPEELSAIIARAGFRNVSYERLMNGIAAVHVGEKAA